MTTKKSCNFEERSFSMTAQEPDIIYFLGKRYDLVCEPLEDYRQSVGMKWPEGLGISSSCWRGYRAIWSIKDDQLFLVKVRGYPFKNKEISVKKLFPRSKGDVKAIWFTGELRIPMGELLEYVHMGYESRWEAEWIIQVEKGNIINKELIENK